MKANQIELAYLGYCRSCALPAMRNEGPASSLRANGSWTMVCAETAQTKQAPVKAVAMQK